MKPYHEMSEGERKVHDKLLRAGERAQQVVMRQISQTGVAAAIKNAIYDAFNEDGGVAWGNDLKSENAALKAKVAELEAENKRLLEGYDELAEQCESAKRKSIDEAFGELERDGRGNVFWRIYTKEMREAVKPLVDYLDSTRKCQWPIAIVPSSEQIDRFVKAFTCPS